MFSKVKGTLDNFFEMSYWSGVRKKIEAHLKRYNFSEIDVPILEHLSLFQRSLGNETDVVSKEMFVMQQKNKDEKEDVICLRPEATAGTMRAFLSQQANITTPCKVFCFGSMFRYERPQKGRLREFHQLNLEMIGAASVLHDAYFIKMLQNIFTETLFLDSFVLKINFLGVGQDRKKFSQALVSFATPHLNFLCSDCQRRLEKNPLRIFDCKSQACEKIYQEAPKLSDFFSQETKQEWQLLKDTLEELAVNFIVDERLVRGLDYYNKTAFEFVSVHLGAQSAFCGGGRYDGLAQRLGSSVEIPAFGCAIGWERLLMILESQKEKLSEKQMPLSCIIPLTEEQNKLALHLADFLQAKGKCIDVLLDDQKVKNKMKKAHQLKATYALLLGEDEQKNNSVTVKNMIAGEQEIVLQKDVHTKI